MILFDVTSQDCAMSRLGNMTCRLGCFATHHEDGSRLLPRFCLGNSRAASSARGNSNNVFKKEGRFRYEIRRRYLILASYIL